MAEYRTIWVSDLHLGTRGANADAFLEFIKNNQCETLYLVGDIIDIWALRRGIYWPQSHNDVLQKILRLGRKGVKVIYIPGNHDEFVDSFLGNYGAITIQKNDIHTTAAGQRILVIHGHELDSVIQNLGWLAHVGDIGYKLLLRLNPMVNFFRRLSGKEYWSLSAYIKNEVKNVVSFISKFEETVSRFAEEQKVEAVLCGHIHHPAIRQFDQTHYYNCGDWVENCSALVEYPDGHIELLSFPPYPQTTSNHLKPQNTLNQTTEYTA